LPTLRKRGPCSPMAEAEDLKSFQCGFDPHRGHEHNHIQKENQK
jgi:hypothetical protein